jgi:hypothetical protein
MIQTLSKSAPNEKETNSDIAAFSKEVEITEFIDNMDTWVCRFLNVITCDETSKICCIIISLWNKILLKPSWYSWQYHALAVMTDMRDINGFRYQVRSDNWDPVNLNKPFIIKIHHNIFVAENFPLDICVKFCVYSTSETINADTIILNLRSNYFNYRKQSLDRCLKHLRQSLIGI